MVRPNDTRVRWRERTGQEDTETGVISTEITPQEFYTRKDTRNKDPRTRKYDKRDEKDVLPLKKGLKELIHGKPDTENLGNSTILTVGLLQGES